MSYLIGDVNMGFFRFKSSRLDLFGERILNGAKATMVGDKVKVSRHNGVEEKIIFTADKKDFFKEMEKKPLIKSRMEKNIKLNIKVG